MKPGWLLLLVVFVVLPLAAVLGGGPLLFYVFGDGSWIPEDSPGFGLVRWWWFGSGREISVGLVAFVVLLCRRVALERAALLAVGAGLATLGWFFAVLLVVLALNPGALS
jgi:hypothetical protein